MDGGIAQLHYSWSRRGIEGANRFQIVRMSTSLGGRLRPLLPMARRICRYDRPAGRAEALPTSFGWFDQDRHRIAFRRVALPPRPGSVANFAAHVLVGPAARMPESGLASLFGSPFWWSGDDPELPVDGLPGTELPELAELPPSGAAVDLRHAPASVALCHALLTLPHEERLAVAIDADEFGWALRDVATLLPQAVVGLSLSTYERSPAVPFRVTGTVARAVRGRQCSLDSADALDARERATLQQLLDPGERAGALREAISQLGRRDRRGEGDADTRRLALWEHARTIVDLADGEESDERGVETALKTAAGVIYLAERDSGIERIAAAVRCGSAIARASLRAAAPRLASTAGNLLYERIVRSYAPPADLRGCAAAAEALPAVPAHELFEQVLGSLLADPPAARTLAAADVAGVLGHAAATNRPADELIDVLNATAAHADVCATRREIPAAYVVVMLRALMAAGASSDVLFDALRARPTVLDQVALSEQEKDRCIELLESTPPHDLEAHLAGLVPTLADARRGTRLRDVLERAPAQAAASLMLAAARADPEGALSPLCDRTAVRVMAQAIERPVAGQRRLALELLRRSRSPSAASARLLLAAMDGGHEARELVRRTAAIEDGELREAVVGLTLVYAVAHAHTYGAVREAWWCRRACVPTEDEAQALRGLLKTALDHADADARICALAWTAVELLPAHRSLLSGARLSDPDTDQLARALADSVPQTAWDELAREVGIADRRARRWWERIRSRPSRRDRRRRA